MDLQNKQLINILALSLALTFTTHSAIADDVVDDSEWEFEGIAYAWLPEIDTTIQDGPTMELPLHEIIENLDMIFFGGLTARKDKLQLSTDVIYMDLEFDEKGSFNFPIGRHNQKTLHIGDELEMGLKAWVVQPMVSYRVFERSKYNIELATGGRYLWLEVSPELTLTGPLGGRQAKATESAHFWDAIVGIRGNVDLTDTIDAHAYLDGGSGDTDYTWQARVGFSYAFEGFTGVAGYRYMKWKFEDDSPLEDMKVYGPYVGAKFGF